MIYSSNPQYLSVPPKIKHELTLRQRGKL